MMLRAIVGIALLALVLRVLTGCTVNVTIPAAPAAANPPAASGHPVNPCAVIICGAKPSRIA